MASVLTANSALLNEGDLTQVATISFQDKVSVWDPEKLNGIDIVPPTRQCLLRIKSDLSHIHNDPPPGMCLIPDEDDMTKVHALLTGPFDTPYEGGFFYFLIRCPSDYPLKPPRVKLMTTSDGQVRFNPNLYRNGKVCLSMLGTWQGPAWSPANSLASVMISIQSLMNEQPYHNEPGFSTERCSGDSKRYNEIIRHETLRVAVCEALEGRPKMPLYLRRVMETSFQHYYDYYISTCEDYAHCDGDVMLDPFGEKRGAFNYTALRERLQKLRVKYKNSADNDDDDESSDSISDSDEESTNESVNKACDHKQTEADHKQNEAVRKQSEANHKQCEADQKESNASQK